MRKESKVRTAWTQTICAGYCWSFAGFEASSKKIVSENKTVPHSSDTMTLIQEDFVPKIANNLRKVTKEGTNTQHFVSASLFKVVKICWISNFLLWPVDFKLSRLDRKKKISMKLKRAKKSSTAKPPALQQTLSTWFSTCVSRSALHSAMIHQSDSDVVLTGDPSGSSFYSFPPASGT